MDVNVLSISIRETDHRPGCVVDGSWTDRGTRDKLYTRATDCVCLTAEEEQVYAPQAGLFGSIIGLSDGYVWIIVQ
jgi:hypothetical protein